MPQIRNLALRWFDRGALLLYALEQLRHHVQAESIPSIDMLRRLNFSNLIERAVKLELVSPTVEKLSHTVREYRNLVHPGLELRKNLEFGAEEAKIACSIIKIVERDLRKKLHDA